MVKRGDRAHDIAAWFGVNQGRIAEAQDGAHFPTATATPNAQLPPSGPPGVKGRDLYQAVTNALVILDKQGAGGLKAAETVLRKAQERYDTNT